MYIATDVFKAIHIALSCNFSLPVCLSARVHNWKTIYTAHLHQIFVRAFRGMARSTTDGIAIG